MDAKGRLAASIAEAKSELDRAHSELGLIQTFNPTLMGAVTHTLSNYISVTAATVEMLQRTLSGHPDADVAMWLDGIERCTDLMQHSVNQLVSMAAPRDFPLQLDRVNVPVLVERSCEYYRGRGAAEGVRINCVAAGQVPLAWADGVALAVVVDNILSNAVRASTPAGVVHVAVAAESGSVVCSIRDSGPGLTKNQVGQVFTGPRNGAAGSQDFPPSSLGGAAIQDFIRRMDGDVSCENVPGQGTRVSFRLPAVE